MLGRGCGCRLDENLELLDLRLAGSKAKGIRISEPATKTSSRVPRCPEGRRDIAQGDHGV